MQFACSVGKTCCKSAGTFRLGGNCLLLHNVGGEFVINCHLLSKNITRTETVMEKGTVSYGVILPDSKQIYKHVIKNY